MILLRYSKQSYDVTGTRVLNDGYEVEAMILNDADDSNDDDVESDDAIITLPTQDVFLPSLWQAVGVRNKVSLSLCITEASWVVPFTKVMASP